MKIIINQDTITRKNNNYIYTKMRVRRVVFFVMFFSLLFGSFGVFDYKQTSAAEKTGTPFFSLKENKEEGVVVTISYMPNVTGFRIYMLSSIDKKAGSKKYKKVTSIKQKEQKDTVYTIKLNNSADYYIKVKAYTKANGKTKWGSASKAKIINFSKIEKNNEKYVVDLNSAKRGDIVEFGSYEQDNITKNGKEPIEWIVLNVDKKENKVFLVSRYGIDAKDYHNKDAVVTWETCSLRKWLNNDFYNKAFTDEEKAIVLPTVLENDADNNTTDNVFLLSNYDVIYGYANKEEYSDCKPTKYAIEKDVSHREKSAGSGVQYCDYWLRSSKVLYNGTTSACYVQTQGGTNYKCVYHGFWYTINNPSRGGEYIYQGFGAVRPAIYVKLMDDPDIEEDIINPNTDDDIVKQEEKHTLDFSAVKMGEIIQFGLYEQNNDITDGKEQIDWIVLSVDKTNNKVLVLSKYILDKVEYYEGIRTCGACNPNTNYTWDNSSVRKWLNNEFFNSAFNEEEKKRIIESSITTPDNPIYGSEGGNDTVDRVFLLSFEEVTNSAYGFDSDSSNRDLEKRCSPTLYAQARGASSWVASGQTRDKEGYGSGEWWLRSSGYNWSNVAVIEADGHVGTEWVCETSFGIRPAMWISFGN